MYITTKIRSQSCKTLCGNSTGNDTFYSSKPVAIIIYIS